jgi:hypothetical protein
VAALVELHAHDDVARLDEAEVHAHVRLRAGVRLHVGVRHAEQRLCPIDRERLDLVDEFAAAVITAARIALGVLVGKHRTDGLEHGVRSEVLRGDHLERVPLAVLFALDGACDRGVGRCKRARPGRCGHQGLLRTPLRKGSRSMPLR